VDRQTAALEEWPVPRQVKEVQHSWPCISIDDLWGLFTKLQHPYKLLRKDLECEWKLRAAEALENSTQVTTNPILITADPESR